MKDNDAQKSTKIPARTWFSIILLGFIGQLAWVVEANWFNTFVFDMVTPDPAPIAWMVATSAVISTATTFLIGTWSDRIGKRKPFLVWGYILWGLTIALFPSAVFFQVTGVIVVMVIVFDGVMTALGSTANDAAYNAWLTDITDETNRAKVLGVTSFMPALATGITGVIGGIVIDQFGYFVFFYLLGAIVLLAGTLSKPLVQDNTDLKPSVNGKYWKQVFSIFRWNTVKDNPVLFLLFITILISGISSQINLPYLFIYLENSIGASKTTIGIVTLLLTLVSGVFAVVMGQFLDRWNRRKTALIAGVIASLGVFLFGLLDSVPKIMILGYFYIALGLISGMVTGAWVMDLYPKTERGGFQGMRMIFQVMLPMVIGPVIGAAVIAAFGVPTVQNGEAGYIPTAAIFTVSAMVSLLSLIPILLTKRIED